VFYDAHGSQEVLLIKTFTVNQTLVIKEKHSVSNTTCWR